MLYQRASWAAIPVALVVALHFASQFLLMHLLRQQKMAQYLGHPDFGLVKIWLLQSFSVTVIFKSTHFFYLFIF